MLDRPYPAALLCGGCLLVFAVFLHATGNPDPNVLARAGTVRTVCEFMAGCLLYRFYNTGRIAGLPALLLSATAIAVGVIVPGMATLTIFGLPVLILSTAERGSAVERAFSVWPMPFLGRVSFSIYLIHWPLLQVSNRLEQTLGVRGGAAFAWFVAYAAVVVGLSALTYRWIEVAGQRLFMGGAVTSAQSVPVPP